MKFMMPRELTIKQEQAARRTYMIIKDGAEDTKMGKRRRKSLQVKVRGLIGRFWTAL